MIFTIFSFLSDVLSSVISLEAASLSNSSLSDMVPGLIDLQLDAKAPSTVLKYKAGWIFSSIRWRLFNRNYIFAFADFVIFE